MIDPQGKYVIQVSSKSGKIIGYIKSIGEFDKYTYSICSTMNLIKPDCIYANNISANAAITTIKLNLTKKTKTLKTQPPWLKTSLRRYINHVLTAVPLELTFSYHGFKRDANKSYSTRDPRSNEAYKGWTNKSKLCSVCHIRTLHSKIYMVGNYAICPFCLRTLGKQAEEVIGDLLKEHPELETEYEGTKFLGAMGATNKDILGDK